MEKKRILIVDDDPEINRSLKKRLEFSGFECESVASVEGALKRIEQEPLDLILLDLGFPGSDGTAFLRSSAQHFPSKQKIPPILVLSCYSDPEIIDHVLESGAVAFMAKPYDAKELISTIHCLTP